MTCGRHRIQELFHELCVGPQFSFPSDGREQQAPEDHHGVYIIRKDKIVLHVGRSQSGKCGLHQRLMNHVYGGSSFTKNYLNGNGARLRGRRYTYQFLVVQCPRTRALLEAYAIGMLCPKHIGLGLRE